MLVDYLHVRADKPCFNYCMCYVYPKETPFLISTQSICFNRIFERMVRIFISVWLNGSSLLLCTTLYQSHLLHIHNKLPSSGLKCRK